MEVLTKSRNYRKTSLYLSQQDPWFHLHWQQTLKVSQWLVGLSKVRFPVMPLDSSTTYLSTSLTNMSMHKPPPGLYSVIPSAWSTLLWYFRPDGSFPSSLPIYLNSPQTLYWFNISIPYSTTYSLWTESFHNHVYFHNYKISCILLISYLSLSITIVGTSGWGVCFCIICTVCG